MERLLDGQLDPASAPPGYGELASLLAAVTAPAAPEELAGEQAVMAEYAVVMRSPPSALVPRRTGVPRKVFTMKAAAAALVAVLSLGGVAAAASGLLPDQASPVADQAAATTHAGAAARGLGKAAANLGGSANAGSTAGEAAGESAVGPDAAGAARAGLCRAWQAGQGADQGQRAESVAFQALVEAAGGADKVAAYCKDMAPGASTSAHGQRPASPPSVSAPSTSVSPPSSGPPASTGPGGHGQGGPRPPAAKASRPASSGPPVQVV